MNGMMSCVAETIRRRIQDGEPDDATLDVVRPLREDIEVQVL